MTTKTIKTAIIVDPTGWSMATPEQEVEEHKERFGILLAPARLDAYRAMHPGDGGKHGIQPGTELVLYDFGGMVPGSTDLMESNARALVKWAEDHPGALVVIVSRMTFTGYIEPEMSDRGLDGLHNIVSDAGVEGNIPDWFLKYAKGEG